MLFMKTVGVILALSGSGMASVDPMITAAAHLAPRATDPSFVGYISGSGGFSNARTCDYPQTVSTSNGYVQCCSPSGSCPFYTTCSDNVLLGPGSLSVPCDISTSLTCNTGVVLTTAGASNGNNYLACWQTSLGANAFTFVQNIGTATAVAATASASAAASGNTAQSTSASGAQTMSSGGTTSSSGAMSSSSSSAGAASTSSKNMAAAAVGDVGFSGGLFGGVVALLAQVLL